MSSATGLTCQHCEQAIEYDPYKREWVHSESRLMRCDQASEAPRAFPAGPRSRDRGPRTPWDGRNVCPDCRGQGHVVRVYAAAHGSAAADGPCGTCGGSGRLSGP